MRPRACHVRACVCVCVCKSVNERERESEREGGRERERNESEIVRACCSVLHFEPTPHAGCGFLARWSDVRCVAPCVPLCVAG